MSPSFRMEFKPVFLFVYVVGSLFGAVSIFLWSALDPSMKMIPTYVVLDTIGYYIVFFAPVYAAGFGLVMSRYFKYIITTDGIRGQNLLGVSRFAEWDSIGEIRSVRIANLSFARLLTSDGKSPIWLPLFLSDDEGFGGTILRCAPEGNVTRNLIRTVHLTA